MDSLGEYAVWMGRKSIRIKLLSVNPSRIYNTALLELDGRSVKVAFPKSFGLDKYALLNVNGENHKIKLSKSHRSKIFDVEVDGKRFVLQLEVKSKKSSAHLAPAAPIPLLIPKREEKNVDTRDVVTASMPGKIVLVKVKDGDQVESGSPLCVLEAMKMENEVVATSNGTITQVSVDQGSFVDKGQVLFVIEHSAH